MRSILLTVRAVKSMRWSVLEKENFSYLFLLPDSIMLIIILPTKIYPRLPLNLFSVVHFTRYFVVAIMTQVVL